MKFTKVAILIVFVLSLCAFVLTAFLSTVRQNEREKRLALESIKTQLEEKVQQLEGEKAGFQTQITDLQTQLADAKKTLQEARDLNAKVRGELTDKDKELEERKKSVEELQHAIQISQDRNHELEETLERLEHAFQEMKKAHGEVTGEPSDFLSLEKPAEPSGFTIQSETPMSKTITETKPAPEVKQNVTPEAKENAPPMKTPEPVHPAEAAAAVSQSLQAGKILLVNNKFNFVVINMGMKQGLKVGDVFMVNADKEKVAKVQVEKLYDDFAAAKIVEQFGNKSLLKEGDLVTKI